MEIPDKNIEALVNRSNIKKSPEYDKAYSGDFPILLPYGYV